MRPSLQLRIGQSLTMTPQLQQAIKLLQLSTLELQQEIQEALETNPLLDIDEHGTNAENNTENAADNKEVSPENNIDEAFSAPTTTIDETPKMAVKTPHPP